MRNMPLALKSRDDQSLSNLPCSQQVRDRDLTGYRLNLGMQKKKNNTGVARFSRTQTWKALLTLSKQLS